jgi:hypothetical protein
MKARYLIVAIAAMALVGGAAVFGLPDLSPAPDRIPTTRPTHGNIEVKVHTLGELGPLRSQTLAAPSVGGTLQIVTLAPSGNVVHEGDIVLEFDRAEQQYNLQQAGSELDEAEQEIVKLEADGKVQASQDKLNLLHAQHEVRRAEINVSGNEFVGKIEAEKNTLALEEARRNLTQLDADIKTHAATNRAARAVLEEKRSKARIAANFARKNIENMTVRAPLTGLVVIKENQNASGGFGFPGHEPARLPPGRHRPAGQHDRRGRRPHRDGSEDKDPGDRARVGELGCPGESTGRGDSRRVTDRILQGRRRPGAERVLGAANHPPVQHDVRAGPPVRGASTWHDGTRRRRGRDAEERHAPAPAGAVRKGRQARRLRARRRRLQGGPGEGRPHHRESRGP